MRIVSVPIPETTKAHRTLENTAAADVEIEPSDLREIDAALAEIQVVGDRYPAQVAALVGR